MHEAKKNFMRLYHLQFHKRGSSGISIPKMLRKSVEHDFTYQVFFLVHILTRTNYETLRFLLHFLLFGCS